MKVFDLYAAYYDLLYRDKDYAAEARYIDGLLRDAAGDVASMLELGCGTGGHALEFARLGYAVHGIDVSAEMVARARERSESEAALRDRLDFFEGDVRSYRASREFDAVLSLFHVISYQTRNADLAAAFATARAHLRPGGVFVFDCWYGPAVLSDRPRQVEKRVADARIDVQRATTSTMDVNRNCVDVRFDVQITSRLDDARREISETHRMRYLFLPEVEHFLGAAGFALATAHTWLTRDPPDDRQWYVCIVARAL